MKVKYFEDTDKLYVSFRDSDITEFKDLDENTVLELDGEGNVCAVNFAYASQRADVHRLKILLHFNDFQLDARTSPRL